MIVYITPSIASQIEAENLLVVMEYAIFYEQKIFKIC